MKTTPKLKAFEHYLAQKQYRPKTIKVDLQQVKLFLQWTEENNIPVENILKADLLNYVHYLQNKSVSTPSINNKLNSIRKYLDYKIETKAILVNPAKHLHIQGAAKKVTESPLSYTQLQVVYRAYKTWDKLSLSKTPLPASLQSKIIQAHQRNIILLGLMLFQALETSDIALLETRHIHWEEGKISIPATHRKNSRVLALETYQALDIHQYIYGGTRDALLPKDHELITGNIRGHIDSLLIEIKAMMPIVHHARQLRASVILHWLKMHNKRQVQYMAGHKWIDSTEKYAVQETDKLQDALSKYHPFG